MLSKLLIIALLLALPAYPIGITTLASIFSIAASSGTIISEGRAAFTHPIKLLKHHGTQIKKAVTGKK